MKNIKNLKTFIVDQDLYGAWSYKQHLKLNGLTDITCFNDDDLFINQLTQRPAIVFLHVQQANTLDSLELLKKIKRINASMYIIVVVEQNEISLTIDALKQGAFDYIIKGDNALDMMNAILRRIINLVKIQKAITTQKWYRPFSFPLFSASYN